MLFKYGQQAFEGFNIFCRIYLNGNGHRKSEFNVAYALPTNIQHFHFFYPFQPEIKPIFAGYAYIISRYHTELRDIGFGEAEIFF